ncbi:MAG: ATP-binding protein [Rubrivivax sp.]|jgi:PAS domain S-box-containing protein
MSTALPPPPTPVDAGAGAPQQAAEDTRWTQALEAMGDGLWDWDLVGQRETVSPRLLQIFGLQPADHNGRPDALDGLTHPEDVPAMQAARDAHFRGETPRYENEHRIRHRDGHWVWVLSRGLVVARAADGRPLRMIGTHTDISERHAAQALRLEAAKLAQAQATQVAFLSRVSHELRTPLNAILGFSQLLAQARLGSERQQAWQQAVVDSGQHLLDLVNDLLELSSARSGQLQFNTQAVALGTLVHEAWQMHAQQAQQQGLQVRLQIEGEHQVMADRTRLKQVLSNLMGNALKYNQPEGWVQVQWGAVDGDPQQWQVQVSNSGAGLSEAQQAQLFQPFERAGAQHTTVPGTGLGLALCRQLVLAMGGHIGVQSAPGEGACFTVQLPRA